MITYTIAYGALLYACAPDGNETALEAEIATQREQAAAAGVTLGPITFERGLILTDEEPEDEDRIVWRGHDLGWLTDEHGNSYEYAIRAA
jgi:hypothetical protein